jgi:aryl-alcohol dehydrogenase-like predicted oxidoreductase
LACLLREIGARHGRTAGEVAIAWTLANPAVTAAIVGVRNRAQVQGVIGAGGLALSSRETAEIEDALRQENAVGSGAR